MNYNLKRRKYIITIALVVETGECYLKLWSLWITKVQKGLQPSIFLGNQEGHAPTGGFPQCRCVIEGKFSNDV